MHIVMQCRVEMVQEGESPILGSGALVQVLYIYT